MFYISYRHTASYNIGVNIDPGPEMAITSKKKKKNPKEDMNKKNLKEDIQKKKDGTWCFTDCTMHREHNDDMIQCHICQIWAHYQCIDEEKSDIIGIWCCNNCRKLPDRVNLLCTHIQELRRDMASLISYAQTFERNLVVGATVSRSDTTPDGYDINDDINSDAASSMSPRDDLIQPTEEDDNSHRAVDNVSKLSNGIPAMSSSLDDAHTRDNNDRTAVATRRLISFVDYSQFCMFSHKTSRKPAKNNPVVKENTTQSNAPRDETKMNDDSRRQYNKYVPMCIHDMYVGHVPHTFTEDAVHSFLRDVNIEHIIRVSKLLTNEKHAGFRVIIGDEDIKNTLYGTKKIHRDAVIMTFKEFRHNTTTHHKYSGRHNHGHNNTDQAETSKNHRKNRHTQVEDSRSKTYCPSSSKSVTFSRSRYIKRSHLHDEISRTHDRHKDHPQRQAPIDTPATQNKLNTANKRQFESTTIQRQPSRSVFTNSQPHILSDIHRISNQSPRRSIPSDVPIQGQQPERSFSGAMGTHMHHPEGPRMSVTLEESHISLSNNAQLQEALPGDNTAENSYPVQRFLPDATLTRSQQPQDQFPSDVLPLLQQQQSHIPSDTSVQNHPAQRSPSGSGVFTQTLLPQVPLSGDAPPLRLQPQAPPSTVVCENCQLMQKNGHPQIPPTQGTVPYVINQSTRIPAASVPCTQLQQPQGQHPGNSQEDFYSYHQQYTRPHLNVYATPYTPQSHQM